MNKVLFALLSAIIVVSSGCRPAERIAEGTEDVARGTGEAVGYGTRKVGEGVAKVGGKLEEKAR
jgi:hypothetical protein